MKDAGTNICKICHADCETCIAFSDAARCSKCKDPSKFLNGDPAAGATCVLPDACTTNLEAVKAADNEANSIN